jgi:serine/threonine-protein phosphatase 2B regulatory subunit
MGNQTSSSSSSDSNNSNTINFDRKELKILYKNFINMDTNKNGLIEPHEFFDVPELKDNPIVQRIITVFDKNGDGKISFYEFVWGLSALTNQGNRIFIYLGNIDEKYKIAFQVYDLNNDGYISNGDLFNSLKMLVGENLTDIQIQQLADRTLIAADKDQDGKISYEEFCEFVKDARVGEMFSLNIFG